MSAEPQQQSPPYKSVGGVLVSEQDDRDYRTLELENGLAVLLVSDPIADKAAAAMDVNVGHLSDPDELPGLAHFLEHMLFLGTEKYPDESSYNAFLNSHGGRSNAFTSMEHTNFFFDVVHDSLEGALDRFAQFFIAPLFTESATEREMNAVDSENGKNLQDDQWRFMQLLKHQFGTGNLQTLQASPQAAGVDTRAALLAFHERWYSANIMRLCIVGRDSLDTLEGWARDKFAAVRNTQVALPEFPGRPFGDDALRVRTRVAPVKDMRLVDMTFPLGPLRAYYKEKPANYLSHLVGHEGPGSILSRLKALGWANELSAGQGHSAADFSTFSVMVECTEEGIEHVDDIVAIVFSYLAMLRREGPQQWVWQESSTVAANAFRFRSKENPMSYARNLAGRMHNYPPEHYVAGASLLWEYAPGIVEEVLAQLVPENLLLHVARSEFRAEVSEAWATEPWYGTRFAAEPVPAATLQRWAAGADSAEQLALPPPNDLLPSDFAMLPAPDAQPEHAPAVLQDDDLARLWFRFDSTFHKPKMTVRLNLCTPVAYESPAAAVLSDVLTRMLSDDLKEFSYMASLAGLHYSFHNSASGFALQFRGFSHKLPVLVQRCCERLAELQIDPERFAQMKERTRLSYANFRKEQPYRHAVYSWSYLTHFPRWHHEDKLDVLDALSAADLVRFMPRLLSNLHLECLVHGNASAEGALDLLRTVRTALKPRALHPAQLAPARMAALPAGQVLLHWRREQNADNENSAVHNYFEVGLDEPRLAATLDLVAHVARERAFEQLRTQEQLGYLVFSGYVRQFGVLGWRLIVQSSHASPVMLHERMEAFLPTFREHLAAMSDEDFAAHQEAVVAKYLQKYKTVYEETEALWDEISAHYYRFDRRFAESGCVRQLSKADALAFWDAYVMPGGAQRRLMSTQVFGSAHALPDAVVEDGAVAIDDDDAFKWGARLHPGVSPRP